MALRLVTPDFTPPDPLDAARERAAWAVREYLRLALEANDDGACKDAMGMIRTMTEVGP